ncbi:beta strand repeat-containing protein [Cellvibrio sp. OA-2007]|uniref:beta strand repeat-containing protein n=1 Tax=Cellvibrio sp. OA-2007 TaxID=529823 RepID=UPI000780613B|nr:hypothetical protein [Cellvibrio sp. OA-2007]
MQTISFIAETSAQQRDKKHSRRHIHTALFLVLTGLSATTLATPFEISTGVNATGVRTVTASETGKINQGASLTNTDKTITWSGATAGTVTIDNRGTVQATGSGRAIDTSSSGGAGRNLVLRNAEGAQIIGGNDAVRINFSSGTVGTVSVDNAGRINSTSGQALDFNAIENASSVLITNQTTGVISTFDADGIRPGNNGVVVNHGRIIGGGAGLVAGATNLSSEAIDFQDFGGTVHNEATGFIEGARHGITGDGVVNVTNAAGGVIRGHNGSGLNLDGTGSLINYGTVSGNFDATLINGDGDGVDIDHIGNIDNYGRIEANGAGGVKDSPTDFNRADGIAMGGGVINNYAGATIYSSDRGILIDDSEGGEAFGATTLTNHGTIDAQTSGVTLQGNWDDHIINSGAIISRSNGVAIDMGGGNDTLELHSSSTIQGSIDGGSGQNLLKLTGTGTANLSSVQGFQSLRIEGGDWTLGSAQSLSNLIGFGSLHTDQLTLESGSQLTVGLNDGETAQLDIFAATNFAGTANLDFFASGNQDMLNIHNTFSFLDSSLLQLNFFGTDFTSGQVFNVLTAVGFNGVDYSKFMVNGLNSDWSWEFNQLSLTGMETLNVTLNRTSASVAEPGTLGLAFLSVFMLAGIRRSKRKAK